MKLVVMSLDDVEQGAIMDLQDTMALDSTVAVVSVLDKAAMREARILCHRRSCVAIERFKFDDDDQGPNVISPTDADRAVRFCLTMAAQNVTIMVVHCAAGIRRSAGMAAAFAIMLGQNDEQFFAPPYCHNMKVYRSLLKVWGQVVLERLQEEVN